MGSKFFFPGHCEILGKKLCGVSVSLPLINYVSLTARVPYAVLFSGSHPLPASVALHVRKPSKISITFGGS